MAWDSFRGASKLSAMFSRALSRTFGASKRTLSTYKTSTGLVGVAVDVNGIQNLINISDTILESVQRVPADSQYRINVQKWFTYMKKTCNESTDIRKIEDEIGYGQIEELIIMAQDELELIDEYVDSEGWKLVADEKSRANEMVKQMEDSIYFSNPTEVLPEGEAKEEAKK